MAIVGCWTTGGTPLVVVSALFVAGGPEPQEGVRRGDSGHEKSSFASLWFFVFTCHSLQDHQNGMVPCLFNDFCQAPTPARSKLIVVGSLVNADFAMTVA